jgi:glycosyltransferase involved in cell wall biosynthesis
MRIWDRLAAERPDFYIANSQYVANRIKKYYRRDAKVIYPGVDTQKFQPTAKENIKDYFLYVSRLVSYKRPDLIIEAFNQTGQKLKIIGAGPEKDKLQKMAKNNIEFLGHISDSDMKKYYAEAKAFVFVAEEDFGIVPVEAMAAGRPVIAYSVGGQAESVIDGKTGVLFHDQTVGCLVKTLLEFDHTKYDVSAIRAQAEKFSIQNFKKNLMEEIERVVELRS